ncbi:MAG: hypothetical protein ACN6O8_07700 [Achromobacter sp.]|uniref:hypothetical protein n=1 Tax=Achromobacter sp. TaxID=134375 RepID=UPI003D07013C
MTVVLAAQIIPATRINMRDKILNYLRSIKWNDPGTGSFIFWFLHILAIAIAVVLWIAMTILDWLFH